MNKYNNRIAINDTLNALKSIVENLVITSIAGEYSGPMYKLLLVQARAVNLLKDEGLDEEGIVSYINLSVKTGIKQGLKWSKIHLHFENNQIEEFWKRLII